MKRFAKGFVLLGSLLAIGILVFVAVTSAKEKEPNPVNVLEESTNFKPSALPPGSPSPNKSNGEGMVIPDTENGDETGSANTQTGEQTQDITGTTPGIGEQNDFGNAQTNTSSGQPETGSGQSGSTESSWSTQPDTAPSEQPEITTTPEVTTTPEQGQTSTSAVPPGENVGNSEQNGAGEAQPNVSGEINPPAGTEGSPVEITAPATPQNVDEAEESLQRLLDYFKVALPGQTDSQILPSSVYPPYYGGAYIDAQGRLVVALYENNSESQKMIQEITKNDNIVFIGASYPYSYLIETMSEIIGYIDNGRDDGFKIESAEIDDSGNLIIVDLDSISETTLELFRETVTSSGAIVFISRG